MSLVPVSFYSNNLFSKVDDLVSKLFNREVASNLTKDTGFPRLDAFYQDSIFNVVADVPGYSKEDLTVEVDEQNKVLYLSAIKQNGKVDKSRDYYVRERSKTAFSKWLLLPEDVVLDSLNTEFKDGQLVLKWNAPVVEKKSLFKKNTL